MAYERLFFKGYILTKIKCYSNRFMANYKSPCLSLKLQFKPIGRYKNSKNTVLNPKNEIFNQLVECRNSKLTCINYHLKWRFHTVQANIHQFSDSNDLFSTISIFPGCSIKLVVAVQFLSSCCKLWQNGDKMVTKLWQNGDKMLSCDKIVTKWCHWKWAISQRFKKSSKISE